MCFGLWGAHIPESPDGWHTCEHWECCALGAISRSLCQGAASPIERRCFHRTLRGFLPACRGHIHRQSELRGALGSTESNPKWGLWIWVSGLLFSNEFKAELGLGSRPHVAQAVLRHHAYLPCFALCSTNCSPYLFLKGVPTDRRQLEWRLPPAQSVEFTRQSRSLVKSSWRWSQNPDPIEGFESGKWEGWGEWNPHQLLCPSQDSDSCLSHAKTLKRDSIKRKRENTYHLGESWLRNKVRVCLCVHMSF